MPLIFPPENLYTMNSAIRCPYCFGLISLDEDSPIPDEIQDFYSAIGIFIWKNDPICTCHGAKYKWYDKTYPQEFFYKDKLYLIYDELPLEDEEGHTPPNQRQYIGLQQISIKDIQDLQNYYKFLEDFIGIPEENKTEFSDIMPFDEGSNQRQIKKKLFKELQDSYTKVVTFLNLDSFSRFNFIETGKFIIHQKRNKDETVQVGLLWGDINVWDGHIRNTHIEDLRHNFLGYWIEDWKDTEFTNNISEEETFSGLLIENSKRYWENNISEVTWGAGQYDWLNTSYTGTATATSNESGILNYKLKATVGGTGNGVPNPSNFGRVATLTDEIQITTRIVLPSWLVINKQTVIAVENFTVNYTPGQYFVADGSYTINYPTFHVGLFDYTESINFYVPFESYPSNPLNIVQSDTTLYLSFENLPEYWGKAINFIYIQLNIRATCRVYQLGADDDSIVIPATVSSPDIEMDIGRITIYPISFKINSYQPSWFLPTGWEERVTDPLPE